MSGGNVVPYCNRATRRKVERYAKKHPGLTFTDAYNKLYGTNYSEPRYYPDTTDSCWPRNGQKETTETPKGLLLQ